MSVLGIVFTTTLLFAAFGFYECIAGQSSWMYGELCNAGYRILFEDVSYGVVYDYAKEYSGQMVQFSMATIDAGKVDDVRPMIVVDEGNLYRFMNEDPLYPFGYGLSYTTFKVGKPRVLWGKKAIVRV